MKKNRSTSIPGKLQSLPLGKSPRNQSTTKKNQFVSLSLKNPEIISLHKENLELRTKLKDFNEKLNNLIISSKNKLSSTSRPETNPELELKHLKRNLEYYENEHNRVEARLKLLSDPGYENKLKEDIQELQTKVNHFGENMKKGEAKQKIREKVLETVLETGETEKNFQEFNELNTEIGLYMKRTRKLEELNAKTVKSWKEIQESQKKFEEKFKELKEEYKALDLKDDTIQKIIGEHNEKLNRKLGVISGELDSKNKVLVIRIKKLQDELEKTRKTEAEIAGKLEQVSVNLRKKQKVLNNLQDRSLNSYRNLLHYEDMNGDTMFITERL